MKLNRLIDILNEIRDNCGNLNVLITDSDNYVTEIYDIHVRDVGEMRINAPSAADHSKKEYYYKV